MARFHTAIAFALVGGAWYGPASEAQQVANIDVQPPSVSLGVGERTEVLAAAFEADGDIATVTFAWQSSDPSIVRVEVDPAATDFATFVGAGPGSAAVTVRAGGRSVSVRVEVSGTAVVIPRGTGVATVLQVEPTQVQLLPTEELQLRPLFQKDDGTLAEPTPITFEWLGAPIGSVNGGGVVTGISPGNALVRVSSTTNPALSRNVPVAVAQAPWAFARQGLSLSPAAEDTLRIVVPSQGSRTLDPRAVSWRSTNQNVAVVTPLGVVTGISGGEAEIVATGFGQENRTPVGVHREVYGLAVRKYPGDPMTVPMGGTTPLMVTPLASDDTPIPDAPVYWEIANPSVAEYSRTDSAVVGRTIGTTTVTARSGGQWETWTVNVVPAGLVLDRHRLGMSLTDRHTLQASYADSTGQPLAVARDVTWRSSNPDALRVSQGGELMPVGVGGATVTASTPSGAADSAVVFVQGKILLTSTRSGAPDVFALDRATPGELTQVTVSGAQDFSPAYSPDGSRIAFVTDRDGNFEIYVMNADGSQPTRLTTTTATEGAPTWMPDGRQIVYQSNADGMSQIWIMNADGSAQRQLTRGVFVNEDPAVSPDGRSIAFASTRDGNWDVYLMNVDGSNVRNVTASPRWETKPQWLGDGALLYVREERQGSMLTRVVVRTNVGGGNEVELTERQLLVRDFAIAPDGSLIVANVELPSPSGGSSFRMFLLPLDGGTPAEVPRLGDRDQLLTPDIRP